MHEIDKNLPIMLDAALRHPECQLAIAAAPALDDDVYRAVTEPLHASHVPLLRGLTWELLHHARAAIVTSASATRSRRLMLKRAAELSIEVIEWEDIELGRLAEKLAGRKNL